MDNELNQEQNQAVNLHSKEGVNSISCKFYSDDFTEQFVKEINTYSGMSLDKIMNIHELKKAQTINFLSSEGKVTQVLCHLNEGGMCKSKNNLDRRCFLL